MMQSPSQERKLLAFAQALAAAVLVIFLVAGLPAIGAVGYGDGRAMHGVLWWLGTAVVAILGSAIAAWVYHEMMNQ